MKITYAFVVCFATISYGAATLSSNAAVEGGAASFVVNTTVPGISVKGKSTALQAQAVVQRLPEGLRLEKMEASLPVKSLSTGMALRDEHMRRYIFTTAEGKTPDLHFEAVEASCTPQPGRSSEYSCQLSGSLSIRGVARPFAMPLKIRVEGAGYRASGEAAVKLSDYGIEQPSQFGVKTSDEVQLRLEFNGKSVASEIASGDRR